MSKCWAGRCQGKCHSCLRRHDEHVRRDRVARHARLGVLDGLVEAEALFLCTTLATVSRGARRSGESRTDLHNRVGRNLLGHRRADVAARAQALLEVVAEVVVAAASVIHMHVSITLMCSNGRMCAPGEVGEEAVKVARLLDAICRNEHNIVGAMHAKSMILCVRGLTANRRELVREVLAARLGGVEVRLNCHRDAAAHDAVAVAPP